MKENFKRVFRHPYFVPLLLLGVIFFVSCFLHMRSFGVYGDDWAADTFLYHNSLHGALTEWWKTWGGEVANFRLLAVILPVVWFGLFHVFGLAGVFAFNCLLYILVALLLFFFLQKSVSPIVAFVITGLFILYPTNNFYLWQVTATYPLSLIFLLTAAHTFKSKKFALTAILLLLSLFINEGVFFLFAIALLPEGPIRSVKYLFAAVKQWSVVLLPTFVVYAVIRIILEAKGVIVGGRALGVVGHFNIINYIGQFIKAFGVVLVTAWGFAGWKFIHFFHVEDVVVAVAVFALFFAALRLLQKKTNASVSLPAWYLMILGAVLIVAGRYYGFYYVPSINVLNLDCRYYYGASLGGALFFGGVFQYIQYRWANWRVGIVVVVCLIFAVLGAAKYSVQRDFVTSWQQARIILDSFLGQVPSLGQGQAVVIEVPSRPLGMVVGVSEGLGDLRKTIPLIYGYQRYGFTSQYITAIKQVDNQKCITSPPYSACVTKENLLFYTIAGLQVIPQQTYNFSPIIYQQVPQGLTSVLTQ